MLRLTELGWLPGRLAFGPRVGHSVRQRASHRIRRFGIWCIGVLLPFPGHIASLLLCWLVVSRRRLKCLVIHRKSKKLGISDDLFPFRSEFLRLQFFRQPSVESRRTAVGLAPLGYTSNGW